MKKDSGRNWAELSGETILQLLNAESGLTLPELHQRLAAMYGNYLGEPMVTWNLLFTLFKVDLIIAENKSKLETEEYLCQSMYYSKRSEEKPPKFRVTPIYVMARNGMEMRSIGPPRGQDTFSTLVFPTFGAPSIEPRADLFALMPFNNKCTTLYKDHIKKVAEKLGLTILRADEMLTNRAAIHDVWTGISGAGGIIADCTNKNPNVFYEIGIAHALGRPVILLIEDGDEMPFDLQHIRYIRYKSTLTGLVEFESTLLLTIAEVLGIGGISEWNYHLKEENGFAGLSSVGIRSGTLVVNNNSIAKISRSLLRRLWAVFGWKDSK